MAIDETRAKLLNAAGHEFAEKGFEGATVRSICERAGANLAAIHYHFGDKERLYEAVVMHIHRERTTPHLSAAGIDPREALHRFIHHFVTEMVAYRELAWHQGVMLREIAAPSKASDVLIDEAFRPQFAALLTILRELCPRADDRQLHATGFSIIAQCLHYKFSASISERIIGPAAFGQLDPAYLVEHITQFTLAAVGHGEPLSGPTGGEDR